MPSPVPGTSTNLSVSRSCSGSRWSIRGGNDALSLDDFENLTLQDKDVFDSIYSRHPTRHSENLFTTLVTWGHYVDCHYAVVDDNLVIMTICEGQRRFRPPMGKENPELLDEVLKLAKDFGGPRPIVGVEERVRALVLRHHPDYKFTPNRDYFDYVYLASDLAELAGKKYLKIRNHLNKFNRKFDYTLEHVTEDNYAEVREFLNRWCLWRDCESDPILENERLAILYSMEHFFKLRLDSLAMRINGKIEALSVFESVTDDMAVVHFEKAMPDFDGIYQAINNETAKSLVGKHEFINRQSDLGLPGLREAKKRYKPHHMEKVYYMRRENL